MSLTNWRVKGRVERLDIGEGRLDIGGLEVYYLVDLSYKDGGYR